MVRLLAAASALALWAGGAGAGEVQDYARSFRAVYADYRMALFATNSGDAAKSSAALAAFEAGWAALVERYAEAPPPQYADDSDWGLTLETVGAHLDDAAADVAAGALPKAHGALEGIRDAIWDLDRRNGVMLFSDRMNAYHAAMEAALATDPATVDARGMAKLLQHAGVLSYLADEIARAPAPEADAADYAPLAGAFQQSVEAFRKAVEAGDPVAVKAAMAGLKPAYSRFFLKFG